MSASALASFVVFIYNRDELQFTRIHEETTIHSKEKEGKNARNTVVNGQKEKPIFVGMGFIGDSEFLILRIETDCSAAKFTRKQSPERKFFSPSPPAFAVPEIAAGPLGDMTSNLGNSHEISQIRRFRRFQS
jgi:hypothetical protein